MPGTKGLHLEQLVDFLVVRELVSLEQPCLELCVGSEERRDFDEIQNPTDALLAECSHQLVEFRLLAGDAVSPEAALGQGKSAGRLVLPERRELDVMEARGSFKLYHCKSSSLMLEKSVNSTNLCIEQFPLIKFPANTCVSSKARNKICLYRRSSEN